MAAVSNAAGVPWHYFTHGFRSRRDGEAAVPEGISWMSIGQYILQGKTPVACDDTIKWGLWLETADRHTLAILKSCRIQEGKVRVAISGCSRNMVCLVSQLKARM